MVLQEVSEPAERCPFRETGIAMMATTEMIRDENPRSLAVETDVFLGTLRVLGLHTSKGEVNGQALVGHSGSARRIRASRLFGLLGTDAGGTLVEYTMRVRETRDSVNVLVGMIQVVIAWMAKALMPKKSFRLGFDGVNRSVLLNVLMERKAVVHHRNCLELVA